MFRTPVPDRQPRALGCITGLFIVAMDNISNFLIKQTYKKSLYLISQTSHVSIFFKECLDREKGIDRLVCEI